MESESMLDKLKDNVYYFLVCLELLGIGIKQGIIQQ